MKTKVEKGTKMDHREHSYYPVHSIVQDHENMCLILWPEFENITIPAKYEVCPDCNGKGKYVNPAIDSHGLTAEDFAEDPDLREDYLSGMYDVQCRSCNGRNVILVPATEEGQKIVDEILEEEQQHRLEVAAERHACGYF